MQRASGTFVKFMQAAGAFGFERARLEGLTKVFHAKPKDQPLAPTRSFSQGTTIFFILA